jgi:hypothetical protein
MRTGDHPSNIVTPFRGSLSGGGGAGGGGGERGYFSGGTSQTIPKTPITTSRQVKEQEAILQSQAGVVINRGKRGRNSLVRSLPESEMYASPSDDLLWNSSCSTRITRGSRPGRCKKKGDLYTEGMYQVYMPKKRGAGISTRESSPEHTQMNGSQRLAVSSPSPLLRKVLTSGKFGKSTEALRKSTVGFGGEKPEKPIEFHKDQYFLVKGEKPRSRNTNLRAMAMLNRSKKLKKMKEQQLLEDSEPLRKESEKNLPGKEREKGTSELKKEATDTVLMGRFADMLIGRPSTSSIYRIVQSEVSELPETIKREVPEKGMYPVLQTPVQKNILQSKRIGGSGNSFTKVPEEGFIKESPVSPNPRALSQKTNTKEFRGRLERFLRWIDKKTLVFSDDMEQYKNSIRAVMKDLIFSSEKRKSMQTAYRIVSLVGTKDTVKTLACQASRELKRVREKGERERKREREREFGEGTRTETETESLAKYRKTLTLGAIDDVFGQQLIRHGIKVIPNNEEKLRKYSNEIYYLWRLLMTSSYAASLKNPKAQFDHFVLGVLYLLAERNIVLCDTVVMEHDPWLKEALPKRKRLCDNYTSKLEKNEVARLIQTQTNLSMDSLTFSTSCRVYNTKIITKGRTRVKDLISRFDQEITSHQVLRKQHEQHEESKQHEETSFLSDIDGTIIHYYLSRNSTVNFIQVGKTSGNIRRAARVYKRRKGLFH